MKKIKEAPSGVLAMIIIIAVGLFIWLTPKSVLGFVILSLILLLMAHLVWLVLTMLIDDLRGR